jgi:hypothetical protein
MPHRSVTIGPDGRGEAWLIMRSWAKRRRRCFPWRLADNAHLTAEDSERRGKLRDGAVAGTGERVHGEGAIVDIQKRVPLENGLAGNTPARDASEREGAEDQKQGGSHSHIEPALDGSLEAGDSHLAKGIQRHAGATDDVDVAGERSSRPARTRTSTPELTTGMARLSQVWRGSKTSSTPRAPAIEPGAGTGHLRADA